MERINLSDEQSMQHPGRSWRDLLHEILAEKGPEQISLDEDDEDDQQE